MITYNRFGLSGCEFRLINESTIRKISAGQNYNIRLLKQAKKQEWFSKIEIDKVLVPNILEIGAGSLCYFDMEYIYGKLFNEEFDTCSAKHINLYIDTLILFLDKCSKITETEECVRDAIIRKLNELNDLTRYPYLNEKICTLAEKTDFNIVKPTMCHGDLTITNMLFTNNQICLLDFLDSYINSYVIDLVKLKQDLYHEWCLDFYPHTIRTRQVFSYMWNSIEERYKHIIDTDAFRILDAVNFLRIEPYLRYSQTDRYELLDNVIKETELYG